MGAHLVGLLLKAGCKVRVLDDFLFGRASLSEYAHHPNIEIIEGDICNARLVSHAVRGAESVVLLAAVIGHRLTNSKRSDMREVNLLGSLIVLDAAIEHGASRFIMASSDRVYGTQTGMMYETSTPAPISDFSRLKLRLEERVLNARNKRFFPTALRMCHCFGLSPRMRFDVIPNGLIRDAVMKGKISIQSGEQRRSFLHVRDAAKAVLSVLSAHVSVISGEIFNVGSSDQSVQIKQLVNIVCALVPEVNVEVLPEIPALTDYRVSFAKIENVLGFKSDHTLEEGIKEMRDALIAGQFPDPYGYLYRST